MRCTRVFPSSSFRHRHRHLRRTASYLLVAAAAVVAAQPALAKDGVLTPISAGTLVGPRLQASTLGLGLGAYDDGRGLEAIGRAALGPGVMIGMGGARGSFNFVDEDRVHFGASLAATFGGGRYRGERTPLLAAAEPGLFLRFITRKAGAVQLNAAWYQPVWMPPGAIRGGLLASIAWHPMFED